MLSIVRLMESARDRNMESKPLLVRSSESESETPQVVSHEVASHDDSVKKSHPPGVWLIIIVLYMSIYY